MGKIVGKFKAGALKGIAAPHASLTGRHYDELARSGTHLTSLRLNNILSLDRIVQLLQA